MNLREKIMNEIRFLIDLDAEKRRKLNKIPIDTLNFLMDLVEEAYETGLCTEREEDEYTGDGDDWDD